VARARTAAKEVESNDSTTTQRRGTVAFTELTDEALSDVLSGSRQRGQYDSALIEFLNMNVRGVQVPLDSGSFEGKKANSVKTGFESARKRDGAPDTASHVRVVNKNDNIFLIRDDIG
jgi:hypothetical protein